MTEAEGYEALSMRIDALERENQAAFSRQDFKLTQLEQTIDESNKGQEHQIKLTAEILEIFQSAKGAVKFIVLAGKTATVITKFAAALVIIWTAAKGFGIGVREFIAWLFGSKS